MMMTYIISKKLIRKILNRVSEDMEISEEEIRGKRRNREIVECRAIISKVAVELGCIQQQVANVIRKERSTINHYTMIANIEAERDSRFNDYLHKLIEEFKKTSN